MPNRLTISRTPEMAGHPGFPDADGWMPDSVQSVCAERNSLGVITGHVQVVVRRGRTLREYYTVDGKPQVYSLIGRTGSLGPEHLVQDITPVRVANMTKRDLEAAEIVRGLAVGDDMASHGPLPREVNPQSTVSFATLRRMGYLVLPRFLQPAPAPETALVPRTAPRSLRTRLRDAGRDLVALVRRLLARERS